MLRGNQTAKIKIGNANEDSDVAAERDRVMSGNADSDAVRIVNLSKVYRKGPCKSYAFKAVDQLCVGIPSGECFGLLGVNGAGKRHIRFIKQLVLSLLRFI